MRTLRQRRRWTSVERGSDDGGGQMTSDIASGRARTCRIGGLSALAASLLVPATAAAKDPKCFPREGHCVAVQVNGQASTKLGKKTKKLLRDLKPVSYYVDDTRYELVEPVRGEIEIRADRVEGSAPWFGEVRKVDSAVVPLQEVDLETHREGTTEETVRVGGAATAGERDVLQENRLPPGRYLLVVTVWGQANWDRQVLFFEVAGE
jgi:hypothetical protein